MIGLSTAISPGFGQSGTEATSSEFKLRAGSPRPGGDRLFR